MTMAHLDKWEITHDYRRLVERGNVPPICCQECKNPLQIKVDGYLDPFWKCLECGISTYPGEHTFLTMKGIIDGIYRPISFEL